MRLLFVSTSVGPLGTGAGGGVELTVRNAAQALISRGHQVLVLAPEGSNLPGITLQTVGGLCQVPAQAQGRDGPIEMPFDPVLGQMWDWARQHQSEFDAIINLAYDWLPLYLTPFFTTPVTHQISMGSLSDAMDTAVANVARCLPGRLAAYSKAQADTFPVDTKWHIVGSGLDMSLYQFVEKPGPSLGWVGRLAPEKGLEDAVAAAEAEGLPLRIWGAITDPGYWACIQQRFPNAQLEYRGFLETAALQAELGQCIGLLMTPKWVEAFGNVVIEALACGVPVVSYRRGGPAEIITHGETGYLAEPDDVDDLRRGVRQLTKFDRRECRKRAEAEYSLEGLGARFESWLAEVVQQAGSSKVEAA